MRKIILFNMVTLDGYFARTNGGIEWHQVDDEFNQFAVEQLDSAGGLIFGRVTYELMADYWPTLAALEDDPIVAGRMNAVEKYVFSRTLGEAAWNNTRLINADAAGEGARLKQPDGGDLFVFGSANLAETFLSAGLIDEFRIMVNPVVLGSGKPLFKGVKDRLNLRLMKTRTFGNGNVLLVYQPVI